MGLGPFSSSRDSASRAVSRYYAQDALLGHDHQMHYLLLFWYLGSSLLWPDWTRVQTIFLLCFKCCKPFVPQSMIYTKFGSILCALRPSLGFVVVFRLCFSFIGFGLLEGIDILLPKVHLYKYITSFWRLMGYFCQWPLSWLPSLFQVLFRCSSSPHVV